VVLVNHKISKSEKECCDIYQEYVDDQYEGAMVRLNGPYEHKRSSLLMKMKPEDDSEGVILDIQEGVGNWAGTGKIISLRWKNKEFNATFKGTHEQAVEFLKNKNKWIGKTVTFLYNGLTGLFVPNFARVDYENCLKQFNS
jgi:ATP-dependent DNA ligase